MLIVSGTITIDPARLDDALALVRPLVAATRAEAGCLSYGFYADPDVPGSFRLYEEWRDQEALDAHMATEHMAEFLAGVGSLGEVATDIATHTVTERAAP